MCLKTENMCLNFLVFKHMFLVFKQHYTYFYILFHSHIFLKDTNNITRTIFFFFRVNNLSLLNIEFF